jgi:hypothetical protein
LTAAFQFDSPGEVMSDLYCSPLKLDTSFR